MVVIAIVGVLSAVAVPAYKNYVFKGHIRANVLAPIDPYTVRLQNFYGEHGYFPTNDDLGVATGDFSSYFPGTDIVYLGFNSVGNDPGQCPGGQIIAYFSNYNGNALVEPSSPIGILSYTFIDINGTIQRFCNYRETIGGNPTSTVLIDNCTQDLGGSFGSDVSDVIENACAS